VRRREGHQTIPCGLGRDRRVLRYDRIEQLVVADDALDALVEIVAVSWRRQGAHGRRSHAHAAGERRTQARSSATPRAPCSVRLRTCPSSRPVSTPASKRPGAIRGTGRYAVVVSVGSGSVTDVTSTPAICTAGNTSARVKFVAQTAASVTPSSSPGGAHGDGSRAPSGQCSDAVSATAYFADAPRSCQAGFASDGSQRRFRRLLLAHALGMTDDFSTLPDGCWPRTTGHDRPRGRRSCRCLARVRAVMEAFCWPAWPCPSSIKPRDSGWEARDQPLFRHDRQARRPRAGLNAGRSGWPR